LPRDLADVLHYFLPEVEASAAAPAPAPPRRDARPANGSYAALPLVALPIGDRDVVRAAFAWNLCVEVARLGGRATLVAPACDAESPLWPEPGVGPLGAELVVCEAQGLGHLHRCALDVAVERAVATDPETGGVVLVRVPPVWLRGAADGAALLRWSLLFSSTDPDDLLETYGLAKLVRRAQVGARVGVTIHGVRRIGEARVAFQHLARTADENLGSPLASYGALVDDLHVYRAIVARRPIGLEHPQSPAARALRDVAGLILEDALESMNA